MMVEGKDGVLWKRLGYKVLPSWGHMNLIIQVTLRSFLFPPSLLRILMSSVMEGHSFSSKT
jgi:hypothetical protein